MAEPSKGLAQNQPDQAAQWGIPMTASPSLGPAFSRLMLGMEKLRAGLAWEFLAGRVPVSGIITQAFTG